MTEFGSRGVIQSDSAVRIDFTVHFWGPESVQLSNKNCYLIQNGSVGLGEVFLNGQVPYIHNTLTGSSSVGSLSAIELNVTNF